MSAGLLDPVNTLISIVGVITGSSSLFILWWKRHKRSFLIFDIYGFCETKNSKIDGLDDLTATLNVAFFNNSDETISITDILGTLKYEEDRYKRISTLNLKGIREVFSAQPSNFEDVIPFSVPPHETVKKQLMIHFPTIFFDDLERVPTVKFVGFLDGKTPLFSHDEDEFKENWSNNPPTMMLTVHANAKEEFRRYIQLFGSEKKLASGTFSLVDMRRIENSFREKFDS